MGLMLDLIDNVGNVTFNLMLMTILVLLWMTAND